MLGTQDSELLSPNKVWPVRDLRLFSFCLASTVQLSAYLTFLFLSSMWNFKAIPPAKASVSTTSSASNKKCKTKWAPAQPAESQSEHFLVSLPSLPCQQRNQRQMSLRVGLGQSTVEIWPSCGELLNQKILDMLSWEPQNRVADHHIKQILLNSSVEKSHFARGEQSFWCSRVSWDKAAWLKCHQQFLSFSFQLATRKKLGLGSFPKTQ